MRHSVSFSVFSELIIASRIISNFIAYHKKRNSKGNPETVTAKTPQDIVLFLTFKCGPKEKGFQGNKVRNQSDKSWIFLNNNF